MELPTAPAHRLADQLLAVLVALGGVDDVEAGVQRAVEEPRHRAAAHSLIADLRAPEAEDARFHVRLAELPSLHVDALTTARWPPPPPSRPDTHPPPRPA